MKIEMAGRTIELGDVRPDDLSIDPSHLEALIAAQTGTWVYWASQTEKLRMEREALEVQIEQKTSELYMALRGQQGPDGKALTEAGIKSLTATDKDMTRLNEELAAQSHAEREAAIMADAVRSRKDCLLALAANKRTELTSPAAPLPPPNPEREALKRSKVSKV
jgi:hypothetical protein